VSKSHHPNPQLERRQWRSLDGVWRFAYDNQRQWERPEEVIFDRDITVPFPPESRASGIGDTGFHPDVWYALTLQLEEGERPQRGQSRLGLHFGAVDYRASVWVNGQFCTEHEGGHTPFTVDLTHAALHSETLEIVVRSEDDPHDMHQPRGKQDWQREPHVIWYPRTTGIWQTVWLEVVPVTRIENLVWTADLTRWEIALEAQIGGAIADGTTLRVRLSAKDTELCHDLIQVKSNRLKRSFALPDAGIEDGRWHMVWSPEHPNLIQASLELIGPAGQVLDVVSSYTALRSVATDGQRFLLNGHPYYLKMVLDQGYWPDSLMTASDEELRADVELTKRLGFNGARKHQKIENPRWLYWCDVLGLLVWEEMPSHYAFSNVAVERLTREWLEVIHRDRSHPCIVAWVVFNESWGVPNLIQDSSQRDYIKALYHLTKALDPTRLAIANDGWEFLDGDWIGLHDYTHKPALLLERYGSPAAVEKTLTQPWGRALRLKEADSSDKPVVLSEFGGVSVEIDGKNGWGYSRANSQHEFLEQYSALLDATHTMKNLAGFCYTQLTDTFLEKNGLLTADRQPKADVLQLAAATRGERDAHEVEMEGEANPLGYSRRWYSTPHEDLHDLERLPTSRNTAIAEPA
jgi:Glycosyl hydrolases family 2, TIM barrel domain/Glycosyl hydrolases family 2, sugar binding domain